MMLPPYKQISKIISNMYAVMVCTCIFIQPSFAQEDTTGNLNNKSVNAIQIYLGAAHYRMIDEGFTFRKILFKGTLPKIEIIFSRIKNRSLLSILMELSNGKVKTKEDRFPASFTYAQFAIFYAAMVNEHQVFGSKNQLYTGVT